MKKWNLLDQATTPDGSVLALFEHDGIHVIRINGAELMSTRRHFSEEKLAELACAHVRTKRGARVLIGGLGFGFTLRAALQTLAPDARVVVAELMGAVITWNRDPALKLAADALADGRVQLVQRDVADVIAASPAGFDAIMLDVDNGPEALSAKGNDRFYVETGVQRTMGALRPDGLVAYWSASANPLFERLLAKCGLKVSVERARAHGTSGGWHTIFLGRLP